IVDGRSSWQVALVIPFAIAMVVVVRPALRRLLARPQGEPDPLVAGLALAVVFAGLLTSAAITDKLGLNFVFGAFAFGYVMPGEDASALRTAVIERMEFGNAFLLPAYFILTGLQVNLSGFAPTDAAAFAILLATAVLSKFGGVFLGARLQGVPTR